MTNLIRTFGQEYNSIPSTNKDLDEKIDSLKGLADSIWSFGRAKNDDEIATGVGSKMQDLLRKARTAMDKWKNKQKTSMSLPNASYDE
jgi:hypothetical protein